MAPGKRARAIEDSEDEPNETSEWEGLSDKAGSEGEGVGLNDEADNTIIGAGDADGPRLSGVAGPGPVNTRFLLKSFSFSSNLHIDLRRPSKRKIFPFPTYFLPFYLLTCNTMARRARTPSPPGSPPRLTEEDHPRRRRTRQSSAQRRAEEEHQAELQRRVSPPVCHYSVVLTVVARDTAGPAADYERHVADSRHDG